MASGAGLNRVGQRGGVTLLKLTPNATAVTYAAPTSPAYGTLGMNDSGIYMPEGIGFTKWAFQLIQVGNIKPGGYSLTVFGTLDKAAYIAFEAQRIGAYTVETDIHGVNWFQLPAPSEQSGTGTVQNPITALGQVLFTSGPLVAVRAVLTSVTAPVGNAELIGFAVP